MFLYLYLLEKEENLQILKHTPSKTLQETQLHDQSQHFINLFQYFFSRRKQSSSSASSTMGNLQNNETSVFADHPFFVNLDLNNSSSSCFAGPDMKFNRSALSFPQQRFDQIILLINFLEQNVIPSNSLLEESQDKKKNQDFLTSNICWCGQQKSTLELSHLPYLVTAITAELSALYENMLNKNDKPSLFCSEFQRLICTQLLPVLQRIVTALISTPSCPCQRQRHVVISTCLQLWASAPGWNEPVITLLAKALAKVLEEWCDQHAQPFLPAKPVPNQSRASGLSNMESSLGQVNGLCQVLEIVVLNDWVRVSESDRTGPVSLPSLSVASGSTGLLLVPNHQSQTHQALSSESLISMNSQLCEYILTCWGMSQSGHGLAEEWGRICARALADEHYCKIPPFPLVAWYVTRITTLLSRARSPQAEQWQLLASQTQISSSTAGNHSKQSTTRIKTFSLPSEFLLGYLLNSHRSSRTDRGNSVNSLSLSTYNTDRGCSKSTRSNGSGGHVHVNNKQNSNSNPSRDKKRKNMY